ncbi:L-histidine N(alpha)-methyltransferase [Rhizosaccharibacter radicis]|uniref:L-histidine N(Alpha)-methyltransferase n=1 Tax=Rhizosaccharibacter radicis TaxID=2782605 RepID=A0ABT1VZ40_9PROT|nr:L-histidine N(alpha)-methyltransferase [Acetobacteraceae bacterium KSS12]
MNETLAVAPAPDPAVVAEILAGLGGAQKTLPAKLFYDAEGCELFNRITRLPEYYVTRAEMALLDRHAAAIAATAPAGAALVEYGAADESKALRLIDAAPGRFGAYVPVDIAPGALLAIGERMRQSHPALPVQAVEADFLQPLALPAVAAGRPAFGFFPGSTIGNFRPDTVLRFLSQARDTLSSGEGGPACFVIGTDLRKSPDRLLPAYDDAAGVTAAFNLNILRHVNRLADGTLDPEGFAHRAVWNSHEGRMEMHLVSRAAQEARVAGTLVRFRAGESIHTEDSYKHTREGFVALAARAGWRPAGFWTDEDELFGMHLLLG